MMKKHTLFLPILFILLLASCNDNPAWVGKSNPEQKANIIASETCKCIYEMLGKEPGIEIDMLMEEAKAQQKSANGGLLSETVALGASPMILKAMSIEEDFSIKFDECECMAPIQENLLNQGVTFDDMMTSLDKNCLLGAFYN